MDKLEIVKALLCDSTAKCSANFPDADIGIRVLIRTESAGVHFGSLYSRTGQECVLTRARRIWYWKGANTLHEIALRGVDVAQSKISEPVDRITLTGVIEVIPLTDASCRNLDGASWK